MNESFEACGSIRDSCVRNESSPIIGAAVIALVVRTRIRNATAVIAVEDDIVRRS